MHPEIMNFIHRLNTDFEDYFKENILEIGSQNTKKARSRSPRSIIKKCKKYIGVDYQKGIDVDIVCLGHEYKTEERFKAILCFEVFEHDPHWEKTIDNVFEHLKDDAIFCWSCAGLKRGKHGADDTPEIGYYDNKTINEITRAILNSAKKFNFVIFQMNNYSKREDKDILGLVIVKKIEKESLSKLKTGEQK